MSENTNNIVCQSALNQLDEYGYPSVLSELVSRFSECAMSFFRNNDPGVLLIGSASRGELSWLNEAGNIQLFSDIEFLVAVTKRSRKKERIFGEQISKLEAAYDLGELFHIDYTVISWNRLSKLEKKFFVFESKKCGIDYGERSVRSALPAVNRDNLNWRELNEVLLHRMSSILHIIPLSIFDNKMTEQENNILALNLAKNSLDITTWLHPYETTKLVPGFSARLATWDHEFIEKSKLGVYFTLDDVAYLESCLALRKMPNLMSNAKEMLGQTLCLYIKAISYCKAMNEIDESVSISDVRPSMKLFDEYRIRQRISQLILILLNAQQFGTAKILRNSIGVRKGIAINVCFYMLLAINDYIHANDNSWTNLSNAQKELSRLVSNTAIQYDDFIKSWIDLREMFKQYQNISQNY